MENILLRNRLVTILYFSSWIIISAIFLAFILAFSKLNFNYLITDSLIFNFIFALLAINLWHLVRFNTFENKTLYQIILNHVAGAVTISVVGLILFYIIVFMFLDLNSLEQQFLFLTIYYRFVIYLIYYLATIIVLYLIIYYLYFKEKLINEKTLQTLMKDNELKTLKYQINPHFIFNSLNSISSLILAEDKRAHEMTVKLSNFIRSTLSKNDNQFVTLCEELKNIDLYLEIEKIRFFDKFNYEKSVEPDCNNVIIPSMIIQPLIENAIKHGVYESINPVTISINVTNIKGYTIISVKNNFDPDSIPHKGEGIGLTNIAERLKLIYKQDKLLKITKTINTFTADIYIPLEAKNEVKSHNNR